MSSAERSFSTASQEETRALGAALGRRLADGDVVLLFGELGAGKTSFTQGLAFGLGVPPERRVASPTFALVNEHTGRVPLHHIDLYRIDDVSELEEIGLRDYLSGRGVVVIEWAERLGDRVPGERLEIAIMPTGPDSRSFFGRAFGARAQQILDEWSL